jgi:hypothetical protein
MFASSTSRLHVTCSTSPVTPHTPRLTPHPNYRSSIKVGYIRPLITELPPPLPTVVEFAEAQFVTRSGRKVRCAAHATSRTLHITRHTLHVTRHMPQVKPKKLSLSPPLRPMSAPATLPALLPTLALEHTISKKRTTKPRVVAEELRTHMRNVELSQGTAAGYSSSVHSADRNDRCPF